MAKDSSRTTDGELQKTETLKNLYKIYQTAPTSPHVVMEGFKKKKKIKKRKFSHPKQTAAYSVVRHDWNFKRDWLLWSDETKK